MRRTVDVCLTLAFASLVGSVALSQAPLSESSPTTLAAGTTAVEAPAAFDGQTNGLITQAEFDAARVVFAEQEEDGDGVGPVYNARGCADCHGTPSTGGTSQVFELRAGRFDGIVFTEHAGGSLIHDRAIEASIQEQVQAGANVRALRASLNVLGDGFVESLANSTLTALAQSQPAGLRGLTVDVPVVEAGGQLRIGRFGWKDQHASLVSFSADAYLNEMGITSPLAPTENTSNGTDVSGHDTVPDPEDDGGDITLFAAFMRSTKAPPADTVALASPVARSGSTLFDSLGCGVCHTRTLTTAPAGTSINGGQFIVPPALGSKIIHPFSDFLLHDVGTGDGIVQNGGPATRNRLRTVPLWGLRTRNRFMHDGLSLTVTEAILRHGGQATGVINAFRSLRSTQRAALLAFLDAL